MAQAPRKVVVIGASSTVGVEVCKRYLTAGHLVTAHFNSSLPALSTLAPHSRLEPVQCDLADLSSVRELANANTDTDILIFLASLATPSHLENIDVSQFERALAVGGLLAFNVVAPSEGPPCCPMCAVVDVLLLPCIPKND